MPIARSMSLRLSIASLLSDRLAAAFAEFFPDVAGASLAAVLVALQDLLRKRPVSTVFR
jgi:hypothetical protein